MDHDAILLHEVGAATPEQGVGLMVNADLARPLERTQARWWENPTGKRGNASIAQQKRSLRRARMNMLGG